MQPWDSQACVPGLWHAQGSLCMEVGSKLAGSKVHSFGMGRSVSSGQGWCLSLEPAQVLILPSGMIVKRPGRAGILGRGAEEGEGHPSLQPAEGVLFTHP